jgi:tRNA-dihydrouridine synthase C
MKFLPKDLNGCPYLIVAPMEGVGDRCFRKAMAAIGGFDEAVTEFIRVPSNAHVKSLAAVYESNEIAPFPLAAQIMGSDPELMADMAREMEKRGAPRIDLNCGCPSNTVTGRGAGSSLLKDPEFLYSNAKAIATAVSIPVTVKMRSGYADISLFRENLKAAEESGAKFITLHPRTKVDGYGPPARWDLIAEAKSLLKIPLVGNGDILTVEDALKMLEVTNCDALMIGRGSVINPFIFHQIRSHFSGVPFKPKWEKLEAYFTAYLAEIPEDSSNKGKINKLKQLMSMLFKGSERLLSKRQEMLTQKYANLDEFMAYTMPILQENY